MVSSYQRVNFGSTVKYTVLAENIRSQNGKYTVFSRKIYGPLAKNIQSAKIYGPQTLKIYGPNAENIRSAKIYGPYRDS